MSKNKKNDVDEQPAVFKGDKVAQKLIWSLHDSLARTLAYVEHDVDKHATSGEDAENRRDKFASDNHVLSEASKWLEKYDEPPSKLTKLAEKYGYKLVKETKPHSDF